jgi:signal transduction histidine kinase
VRHAGHPEHAAPFAHRPRDHTWLGRSADLDLPLAADALRPHDLYGGRVISSAVRSFWAEPAVADPPARVWRDWAVIGLVIVSALLEALLRTDLSWPAAAFVLSVVPAFGLLWRRTHPLTVALLVFSVPVLADLAVLLGAHDPPEPGASVYVLLIPYALLRWGSGRDAIIGMAYILVVCAASELATSGVADAALVLPFLKLPAAVGLAVRYRAASRLREREQVRLLEREQLARELHDTVAHHVSAIAIRAQAGREVARSRPEAAVEALDVIEEAASRTLEEMRAMVGALRQGEEPDLAPQRGIADIARLAAAATPDRPCVDVDVAGDLRGLRPSVQAAVYRLAQESITNALRHARHASRVDVRVVADEQAVRLTVRDDGDAAGGPNGDGSGYGLVGMTERTTLLGGSLEAGPDAAGGWTVSAVLPRNGAARA